MMQQDTRLPHPTLALGACSPTSPLADNAMETMS
ncbi:hypothetical protein LCEOLIKB_01818 [Aeromonas hydrophila]